MAIPKYDEMMLPLLRLLADGQEHRHRELADVIADHFKLTPAERDLPWRGIKSRMGLIGGSGEDNRD